MFEKQPQVVRRVAASSVQGTCSSVLSPSAKRADEAPGRPGEAGGWRALEVCPGVGSPASAADRCGWLRALSLATWVALSEPVPRGPSGVTSENTVLPGPLSQGCGGESERGQEGTGALPREPPPPGSDAAFVVGKDKRGPVWKIPSDRTEASAPLVWRPGSAGWAGLAS